MPFQLNPHFIDGHVWVQQGDERVQHFGETRDERIAEYHERNERPVIGLFEGAWLQCDADEVRLEGGPARLFRKGEAPRELEPPMRLEL